MRRHWQSTDDGPLGFLGGKILFVCLLPFPEGTGWAFPSEGEAAAAVHTRENRFVSYSKLLRKELHSHFLLI